MATAEAVQGRARKSRARIILSISEVDRIKRRLLGTLNGQPSLLGFVASRPWADYCVGLIESGMVPARKKMRQLEADLHDRELYPPGGKGTTMVENDHWRFVPPDYTGRPLDQREDELTYDQGVRLPSSCSAVMLRRAMYCKAKPPERRRLRSSRG